MSTDTTSPPAPVHTPPAGGAVVPIRSMGRAHLPRILAHLLALNTDDRYLRFGYSANDEQIGRYVDQLNFERDELFGIFNRKLELIAMAHLAFSVDPKSSSCAEFGVSVARTARGRGYGSRLFERAVMHARNEGVNMLFIHALSENKAMLRIARKAGAVIERDGPESEAHLRLPPADFDSRVTEMFNEQVALTDYHLKAQVRHFWDALAMLQEIRQGVRKSRDQVRG
jgi:RimJ/RimL family protein N-acetyltransferase